LAVEQAVNFSLFFMRFLFWRRQKWGFGGRGSCFCKRQNEKYTLHSIYTNKSTALRCFCCYFVVIVVVKPAGLSLLSFCHFLTLLS